ncbi:uncharacterized protein KD926_005278 [Aspergillus affinis]|uniref:uncharacterized protein n=1 Tax=Aspergillus affinis TaxID=1070780 RepID=UPI0022FE4FE5|nr:uncharacterized protein KD926_005278 [Aspergillus affinis]KAI9042672.1 hypothetical protein KD926_005278 [Aspergillus affinis]
MRFHSIFLALLAAVTGVVAQDSFSVALVMADNTCWAEFTNLHGCSGRSNEPIGDWDGTHCTDNGKTDVSVCDSGHVMFKYEAGPSPLGPPVPLEANTLVFKNDQDTYPMPFNQPDPGCLDAFTNPGLNVAMYSAQQCPSTMASLLSKTSMPGLGLRSHSIRPRTTLQTTFLRQIRMPSPWAALKSLATKSADRRMTPGPPETPRELPATGFKTIDIDQLVEEEELPDYRAERFYPVRLGEVLQNRYQIIAKLGFGTSSTVWLARDLKDHQYVTLKLYVHTSLVHRELPFYHHIASRMEEGSHPGRGNVRRLLDSFEVTGPQGKHVVLVFQPAQMSLRDMKLVFRRDGFDEDFVRGAITELLKALDFLHTHGEIVHTDIHPGNLLLGVDDNELLRPLEEKEFSSPVPRKSVSSTHLIYLSRLLRPNVGPMLLSDFGEARIGPGPHAGDVMPLEYRAPETLHYVKWSYPVDIWSVGLTAWDLLESKKLFTARDDDGDLYDAAHLAQFIAALGPPPPDFLSRNRERKADFWDEQGKWLGLAPIPQNRTLEALETKLEDNTGFLRFIRRILTWMPEDRPTAKELLEDPWVTGEATRS